MHEFRIAENIVEAVRAEAARLEHGTRVVRVGVTVGDLSGVDVEALRFSFDVIVANSDLAPLELDVERQPHTRRCNRCSKTFTVDVRAFDATCPGCHNPHTDFVEGKDLEITYLEAEDR
jgi:hydrogenase nickel incorporation protein HypA/HybF